MNGKTTPIFGIMGIVSIANSNNNNNFSVAIFAAVRSSLSNPVLPYLTDSYRHEQLQLNRLQSGSGCHGNR